jgi:glycosyltransferase domain-containing protein
VTPEEIDLLSELTVIVLTYDRPLELERAIEYWRDTPVTVFIIDGSEKAWFLTGALPISNKIFYYHMPQHNGESNIGNYCRRMEFASRLPRTKFSALCADDDFFTITGMIEFCQRLKVDESLDALVGNCAEYTLAESGELFWNLRYSEWKASSDSQDENLRKRVLDTSSIFYLYYAIMRTECWKQTVLNTFKVSYDHGYFHEHAMKVICRAFGKSTFEKRIYWVKEFYKPNPGVPDQVVREADWFRNPKNELEVKKFKNHLSDVISQVLNESDQDNEAKDIVSTYLQRVVKISDTAKFRKVKKQVLLTITRISRTIPMRYRRHLNQIMPKKIQVWTGVRNERPLSHLIKNNKQKLIDFCMLIEDTDIQLEASDLLLIERVLSASREELRLRANI